MSARFRFSSLCCEIYIVRVGCRVARVEEFQMKEDAHGDDGGGGGGGTIGVDGEIAAELYPYVYIYICIYYVHIIS